MAGRGPSGTRAVQCVCGPTSSQMTSLPPVGTSSTSSRRPSQSIFVMKLRRRAVLRSDGSERRLNGSGPCCLGACTATLLMPRVVPGPGSGSCCGDAASMLLRPAAPPRFILDRSTHEPAACDPTRENRKRAETNMKKLGSGGGLSNGFRLSSPFWQLDVPRRIRSHNCARLRIGCSRGDMATDASDTRLHLAKIGR